MNQQQSLGSNNQQQGLPDNRNQQTKSAGNNTQQPVAKQPEKPAVTDDSGDVVDRNFKDAGKGYNEPKPTESWSTIKPHDDNYSDSAPEQQDESHEKVYGKNSDPGQENLRDHNFPQQANQEEKETYEKRRRQSGNVPG